MLIYLTFIKTKWFDTHGRFKNEDVIFSSGNGITVYLT